MPPATPVHYDVVVVGAGISGIGTAYWLQRRCPQKSFVVLEGRETLGGTWSLFRYPGVRSDSDMFTFGYRFRPWREARSLSGGEDILRYLSDTVEEHGLDRYIRYNHRLLSANWSPEKARWELEVSHSDTTQRIECDFLSVCSGYYDYEASHRPDFPGEEQFGGQIVVPQFWPGELDYTGQEVVVVGSGATAVTLVPAMAAGGAARVTMLQRSPTYVINMPNSNAVYIFLRRWLPDDWAYRLTRWMNIAQQMLSFAFSRGFPKVMKDFIMREAARQLPPDFDVHKHFNPTYDPWDQRLCVIPDGDLFQAISAGRADVVTDEIDRFTAGGIRLQSGQELPADLIVLATGLKIKLLGGASVTVDGRPVDVNKSMIYKGMMVSDVPNLIYAFGYTNASWTLKVDLTANYLCKLLNYMDRRGYRVVVPEKEAATSEESFLNLNSGYVERARHILPQQGERRPWRVYQSYLVDMLATRLGGVVDRVLRFF